MSLKQRGVTFSHHHRHGFTWWVRAHIGDHFSPVIGTLSYDLAGSTPIVTLVHVDPAYRRQGLATRMLVCVELKHGKDNVKIDQERTPMGRGWLAGIGREDS